MRAPIPIIACEDECGQTSSTFEGGAEPQNEQWAVEGVNLWVMLDDALRALPKVELHCHLELTARHDLLKELLSAKGRRIDDPLHFAGIT